VTEAELNHALIAKIIENEELKRLVVELREAVVWLMTVRDIRAETVEGL
jgi:hypothetical protein